MAGISLIQNFNIKLTWLIRATFFATGLFRTIVDYRAGLIILVIENDSKNEK
jgi:hypothetical protein